MVRSSPPASRGTIARAKRSSIASTTRKGRPFLDLDALLVQRLFLCPVGPQRSFHFSNVVYLTTREWRSITFDLTGPTTGADLSQVVEFGFFIGGGLCIPD
jgi:hypothetical protein